MKTKEIEKFYNASLIKSDNSYEYDRWEKTSQGRASFIATKKALHKHALPLITEEVFSILEIGPGPGTWTKEFLKKASGIKDYDLVDISEEMLTQAKENIGDDSRVNLIHSDILDFVPTKKYDFFFSSRFIEYVPEKNAVVQKIAQSLKSGGQGYIVTKTPQYHRPFSKQVVSPVHQNQISSKELIELFAKNGLKIKKVVNVTSVFPGLRSGVLDKITTNVCNFLPFKIARIVSESYAIIFEK